jgi:hypothetical protein
MQATSVAMLGACLSALAATLAGLHMLMRRA